jgi:TonB family protein
MSPDAQSVQSKNGEFIFSQYPPRAKAAGEQGSVRFRAEVDDKGNPLSCTVTAGSGYQRLDQETCDLIIDHATFATTLDAEGKARAAVRDGIVNWKIPGATVQKQAASASGRSPDEVVCKRVTKTGSLVSHSRLCMTRGNGSPMPSATRMNGAACRAGWAAVARTNPPSRGIRCFDQLKAAELIGAFMMLARLHAPLQQGMHRRRLSGGLGQYAG